MLNSVMGDSTKVAYYIRHAEEKGIQILPPSINESIDKFAVSGNKIRFGLSAVKNVGVNVIRSIVKSREEKGKFTDLEDFCSKIDITCINKRVVDSLIKSGAFDCFGVYRSQLLDVYEKVLDGISNERKRNIEGQMSLFAGVQDSKIKIRYPDIREFDKKHLLAMEKEMTGLYLTGHPLDQYESALRNQTSIKISDIVTVEVLEEDENLQVDSSVKDGDKVIIGGIITGVSRKITRNNANMAFVTVEDLFSAIEVVIFPKTYEKCKGLIEEDGIVLVKGRVSIKEDEKPKLLCESLDPLMLLDGEKLFIQIEEDNMIKDEMSRLKQIILDHKGNVPVYLFTKKERKKYRLDREFWVKNSLELMTDLRSRFGDENVKLT
jgi:DNA polymerase-3 subunit alpha